SGSHIAVKPSVAGSLVFEALWAIPAEPTPAALENRARWMPITATPMMPPVTPSAVKAPVTIWPSAWGRAVTLTTRMSRMHAVYSTAIAGVSAEVQRAIDFTPPRITAAVRTATTTPMIQPLDWRAPLP